MKENIKSTIAMTNETRDNFLNLVFIEFSPFTAFLKIIVWSIIPRIHNVLFLETYQTAG